MIFTTTLLAFLLGSCTEKKSTTPEEKIVEQQTELAAPEIMLTDEVKPVFFDYTSTGCPGCGSWGAPTFESLSDERGSDIVPMAVHIKYGDPMITEVSNAIASNRTGQYFTPQLWVNNTNSTLISGGRINGTGSLAKIKSEIENFKSAEKKINVGVSSVVDGSDFIVRYKTQAINDLVGEYFIGLYVMENGISAKQSSSPTDPTIHNHVIRACQNGAFGTLIASEGLTKDGVSEGHYTFKMDSSWNSENLYATIIVWNKESNNYFVVNADNNNL
ncbi:MAG: Omp28-related outer membrane protein [Bacteroidia bacterium]